MKAFEWFLHDGSALARLLRTLAEVLLSFLIANIGDVTGLFNLSGNVKAMVVSLGTLVFTAILGFINDNKAG